MKGTDCSRCGRDGHTKSDCYARTDIFGHEISPDSRNATGALSTVAVVNTATTSYCAATVAEERCTRCGRDSHTQSRCFASTFVDGRALTAEPPATSRPELRLSNVTSQAATGVNPFHAAAAVAANPLSWAPPLQPPQLPPPSQLAQPLFQSQPLPPAPSERCPRCGRDNHTQSRCFASTSVDGRALTAEPPATSRPELRLGNVPSQAATGVNPFHAAAAVATNPSSWAPPLQPPHPSHTSQLTQPLFQSQPPPPAPSVCCSRCGRDNHTQSRCFASTSVDGRALTAETAATSRPELRLGNVPSQAATVPNPFHAAAAVAAHPSSRAPPLQPSQPSQTSQLTQPLHQSRPPQVSRPPQSPLPAPSVRCSRCGRDSHTQSRCFASTHISGRYL
jgi:hypothetical protein